MRSLRNTTPTEASRRVGGPLQGFTESVQRAAAEIDWAPVSSQAPAVEVDEITRVFQGKKGKPDVVALDAVSLAIPPGEIHGLLGPNGAGKTTLVKILSTVLLPTSGRARVLGHDVVEETKAVRPLIGIVFGGERGLYWRLTGAPEPGVLGRAVQASARETKARAQRLIERVGLTERADERVETYSRGMKQRLHLARGLIGDAHRPLPRRADDRHGPAGGARVPHADRRADATRAGRSCWRRTTWSRRRRSATASR